MLPRKPTRTTQITKHYYKLTIVNGAKGDSFEHWLVMYLLKYWFRIIFNQKKLRTAALKLLSMEIIIELFSELTSF